MTDIEQARNAVQREWGLFEDALPGLMSDLEGRWVVFRGGIVVSDHADEDSARTLRSLTNGSPRP